MTVNDLIDIAFPLLMAVVIVGLALWFTSEGPEP